MPDTMDNSSIQARLDLVSKYAAVYFLEPSLICAVCEKESAWNQWAIRYELEFEKKYVRPEGHSITESIARSISWGFMQIMGESAREMGFTGHLASLCDPQVGLPLSCQWLRKKIDAHGGNIHFGLQAYNGGGDPNYAADVIAREVRYRIAPTLTPDGN